MPEPKNGNPVIRPWDRFNQDLAAKVHPPGWTNPKPAARYNLVVIGAGTAGLVSAAGAAGLGAKVALVERHLMGGDCLNVGCVPSKALIGAARAAAAVRNAAEFGVHVPEGVRVDFGQAMERMRRLRASIAPTTPPSASATLGIDVFIGEGRFVDAHTVRWRGRGCASRKRSSPPAPGPRPRRLQAWIKWSI
jgi:pyruvate/2-oxoglutarate dehydrogenase complex dihydrolipoamide dehydrogenase (E3) component